MKIIPAKYEIIGDLDYKGILKKFERCGRVCYKSENKATLTSSEKFVHNIIKRGHEAVIEHYSFSVKFTVDRGVSHEIVRHRVASYCQESTRYCNYSNDDFGNEITVILPHFLRHGTAEWKAWESAMSASEKAYFEMLEAGCSPQEARSVLPNSLKTEIVMTANVREWRHFLKLRTANAAHPQIREIAVPLLIDLQMQLPALFDDINL